VIGSVLRVRYELTKLLSENTFFAHYSAYDKVQSREVSIRLVKEPYAKDAELLKTLEDLVKRLSSVRHPAIEELYEVDSDDNAVFIVGQLTPGASVAERLHKLATFSVPATIEVGIAICDGLQALHRAGIADGDVSSATIAMQADGEVRLQNAGLWQAFFENQQGREAFLIATAAYSAPEISKGALPTPASDIYSLGVLMYELLTGRKPYVGDSALVLALKHATEPVPSVRQASPSAPQPLDHIVAKAMSKAPADRYADGGEMLSDLRMLQDALRFGKSLTWPLRAEGAKVAPVETAPATSGAPSEKSAQKKVKAPKPPKPEVESDVPGWLRNIILFAAGILAFVVFLVMYLSLNKPVMLKVPQLKNLTMSEAKQTLESIGLKLTVEKTKPTNGPADTILSTDPGPGEAILKGEDVKVTVSAGSKYVEVPDLRGLTPDKARETLRSVGLDLDDRIDKTPNKDVDEGLIVSQAQPPRGKYERGTKVRVQVSSGRQRTRTSDDPDADRKYVYTLTVKLSKLDQPVRVRVDMTDARGTKTIVDAEHNPDETLPIKAEGYGSQVTFRIFYNGELVKQMPVSAKDAKQSDSTDDTTDNQ